jgi:hypothetical protein
MARLRYNGLKGTLGASLTSSATAVTFGAALTHSNGTAVPTIAAGDYIPLTILNSTGDLSEIVYLTAYTSGATTGTITRGQEGTTGVAHSSGDKFVQGPTTTDVGGWSLVVDNPLSSLTGWTSVGGGTWTIVGGVLNQSSTTAAVRRFQYDTALPATAQVVEFDVKINTSTSTASGRAGVSFGGRSSVPLVSLLTNTSTTLVSHVDLEYDSTTNVGQKALGSTIATGTWITFRAHLAGERVTVWVNGTLVESGIFIGTPGASSNTASFSGLPISLYTYATDSSFRNLRVWVPTLP